MRQQRVFIGDVRVSMKADRSYIVSSFARFFIQCLNILERVLKFQAAGFELVRRQTLEHERIVGVRRVRECYCSLFSCLHHS